MEILLNVVAAALIALGLAGAIVPAVPGIPLIFAGIWLIAGVDHYHHLVRFLISDRIPKKACPMTEDTTAALLE